MDFVATLALTAKRATYFVLAGIMMDSPSVERKRLHVSPDGDLVATVVAAGKKKGFEEAESRIEVWSREGNFLVSKDFSSEDGEHGAAILHGYWTADSRYFVFLTGFSGGHESLQHPIYFYCRRENAIQMLSQYLHNVLIRDFSLEGKNTVAVEAVDSRGGTRKIFVRLGTVPCKPIATCYRLGSPHRTVPATEYIFREDFNPQTGERRVYVQRRGDNTPRLIFTHSRGASVCVGPSGRLALINSEPATKTLEVWAAELPSGSNWRIDKQAMDLYQRHASPNPALIIVPWGEDMSPDDCEVLLRMDLIYISVPTAEQAEKVGRTFKEWWYVVNARNGNVLREYRRPPPRWWVGRK